MRPNRDPVGSGTSRGKVVSASGKIGLGILLPTMAFVAYQVVLIEAARGRGDWAGMGLAFGSFVLVPGLLIANCWVLFRGWRRRLALLLSGFVLPGVIGVMEYVGIRWESSATRTPIDALFVSPFVGLWLIVALVFSPLLLSVALAIVRARTPGQ